eukprot:CAMPEP_0197026446 /NCGR_PEP_ID=MMETSP1384-20130603/6528_1 /TAXON_ID=29189 /ORGANISM="Ammonia sp." /LENGTH=249 /DNA_ID=CAMNT_0042455111 /DNA_START=46 /DNA_END=795 /DNA_ORIENTATION=-
MSTFSTTHAEHFRVLSPPTSSSYDCISRDEFIIHASGTLLVTGYAKQYIAPQLDQRTIIPFEILKLCQAYFAFELINLSVYNEAWYKQEFVETEIKTVISPIANSWLMRRYTGLMYSDIGYLSGVHHWKLQCVIYGGSHNDCIGITTIPNTSTWINSCCVGTAYFAFNEHLSHYINGEEQRSLHCGEMWTDNDDLFITLDFKRGVFKITRIRDMFTPHVVYSIDIDATRTYYLCIGMRQFPAKYQFRLC